MTMEQIESSSTNTKVPSTNSVTNIIPGAQISSELEWNEELNASFVCRLCSKSFYNAVALQNHKNLQHDKESEGDVIQTTALQFSDYNVNGLCGFKFIPLKKDGIDISIDENDDMTPRVFTQDTTYLVIKVATDDGEIDAAKRRRLEGVVKRTQMKPGKPPVDLRGPFTCTFPSALRPDFQCRQIFFNCCEYSMHYREEHTKRRKAALRCQVCEKRLDRDFFPAVAPLQTLCQTFSCRLCGQTFFDSAHYDEHNRLVHAKTKPHQCTICAKRFTQQGGLQQHMRMHTGIRPFGCTFCPKAFTQKAGLDQHLRTHTKVKPFKCVICSKCFSQSVHLRQHMRTHTNIQPFECSVCGRRFKQTSHLNFHMRSHGQTGEGTERFEHPEVQVEDQMDFLSLANLQPVVDGETLYFAAELAPPPSHQPCQQYQQPQVMLPHHILSL